MNTLPDELILVIFESIPLITDKRHFLRVNTQYNIITTQSFMNYEKNYKIKDFDKIEYYSVEKFTLELCHDRYFDLIPESYIIPSNNILIKSLSYFNNIKLLELAKLKSCYMNSVTGYAALGGNLDVVQWARGNDYYWNSITCSNAALNGHLHVLQWLRKNGCKWDRWTCATSALNGHLEVLQWARDNGCVWDRLTCWYAAENGHLSVLKWARENGCDWDQMVYVNALKNGHLEVLEWARTNGCPE